MTVFYKTLSVPMTAEDVEKNTILTEEEKAVIGQVYLDKEVFNAECNRRLKDAKKSLAYYVELVSKGEHEVPCRVEVDYQENRARIYREDTNQFVRSRAIEDDEKQSGMPWSAVPETVTISESAKKKQPGLKDAPDEQLVKAAKVSKALLEEFGQPLALAIILRTEKTSPEEALTWGRAEKAKASEAAPAENPKQPSLVIPEDLRKRIVEEIGEAYVDGVWGDVAAGMSPKLAIEMGLRLKAQDEAKATVPAAETAPDQADAKPKKTRAKKAKAAAATVGDAFEPATTGASYRLMEEDWVPADVKAALNAATGFSAHDRGRLLLRVKSGETLSQAIEAERELKITAAVALIGEDQWPLLEDEFGVDGALSVMGQVKMGSTLEGAVAIVRKAERKAAADDSLPLDALDEASEGA